MSDCHDKMSTLKQNKNFGQKNKKNVSFVKTTTRKNNVLSFSRGTSLENWLCCQKLLPAFAVSALSLSLSHSLTLFHSFSILPSLTLSSSISLSLSRSLPLSISFTHSNTVTRNNNTYSIFCLRKKHVLGAKKIASKNRFTFVWHLWRHYIFAFFYRWKEFHTFVIDQFKNVLLRLSKHCFSFAAEWLCTITSGVFSHGNFSIWIC